MYANPTQFKPSQRLDSDYRTLVTTYKGGNYKRKWLLYAVFVRIIFKTTKGDKTIMNTIRGDQTDNVVDDMNNVKLVIKGENGFHMLYLSRSYSTQQKETQQ